MALIAVGVLAAASVGFFVLRAVRGESGGANDPEAAVVELGQAIEAEDPVGALAVMNPEEVEALGDVYRSAAARAERLGFAPGSKTLGGVTIELSGVTYRTRDIGPRVARVTIVGGSADASVTRSGLGSLTDAVIEQDARGDGEEADPRSSVEIDTDDLTFTGDDGDDIDPFVIAVERGGGWYVSPLYTAAQYLVDSQGLDMPDLEDPEAGDGADSPEDAVRDVLVAAGEADGRATGGLVSGEAGVAVSSYRRALEDFVDQEAGSDSSATVDRIETDVNERDDGGMSVVVTELEGELRWTDPDTDDERSASVQWDGECLDIIEDDEADEDPGDPDAGRDFCLTDSWNRFGVDELAVAVSESDGGWRVDPVATLADYAADIVPELTETAVLRILDYPEVAEPTDELSADAPTTVELNDAGFAVLTLEATEGEPFTITAEMEGGDGDSDDLDAYLVAPDGSYESASSLVEPTESGQYRLVVAADSWSPASVEVTVSSLTREPLTVNQSASDSINDPGEILEYEVNLTANTGYEVTVDNPGLVYTVFDPTESEVTLTEIDDEASSFETDDEGTYRIRVESGTGETGSFEITVERVPDFILGNGSSSVATGSIDQPGVVQFIDLQVRGGVEVIVDLVPDAATLDPVFIVRDPDTDVETDRYDDTAAGGTESVRFTPDAVTTTTYRIAVAGSGGTTGSFRLEARRD